MPDWFYRTISRPVLFRLPPVAGRNIALGFMGTLARLPLGPRVIDFLGHMRPDARLQQTHLGVNFATPIGLGPWLDTEAMALPALARFGLGFLEVGPITLCPSAHDPPLRRWSDEQALWYPEPPSSLGLEQVQPRLKEAMRLGVPVMARLGCVGETPADVVTRECQQITTALAGDVTLFSLATLRLAVTEGWSHDEWTEHIDAVMEAARKRARPVLLGVPADMETYKAEPFLERAMTVGIQGLVVDGSVRVDPEGQMVGAPAREPALEQVRRLRQRWGTDLLLIAGGGVHEPGDVTALRAAGADLVQIDTGLVFTGPGLPKRSNDLLLYQATRSSQASEPAPRPAECSWFWTALMGLGMFLGSVLTLAIAATQVVLPYDEAFVGMTRGELAAVNPRLLPFMAHDRVSLAGTMIAIGVMYLGLSLFGGRKGLHWAQWSIFVSAFTGFASFFSFLSFGYLDPFHAFVTAVLLQLLLLGIHCRVGTYVPDVAPEERGDWRWRVGLWGQLLLVLHGVALLGAGLTISGIGVTHVFVHEDLEFMQTTAETLRTANPRLVPLVAHDRATFGGMIVSSGWAFLLPALWGFRQGAAWLWWTMLLAGLPAYAAAIGVHYGVGYIDFHHLLPAFSGLTLLLLGLGLAYPYLCGKKEARKSVPHNPSPTA